MDDPKDTCAELQMSRRQFVLLASGTAAGRLLAIPSMAVAEAAYPTRQITIVAPAAAGGPTDFVSRTCAAILQRVLGQPVIVENRTGASGNIAAQSVAKAQPDGHTLITLLAPLAQNVAIFNNPGFDLQKDFKPLSLMASTDMIVVAKASAPFSNLSELLKLARGDRFVTCGGQSPPQIEYLKRVTKASLTVVPYRGAALTMTDVLAGQIEIGLVPYGDAAAHLKGGTLKGLFTCGHQRVRYLPDMEAVAETFPGFGFWSWYGIAAPAQTPVEIGNKLQSELVSIARSEAFRSNLETIGLSPIDAPERFDEVIAAEIALWQRLVEELKLPRI